MLNIPVLFRKSVYSPSFYKELLEKPFSFSLKYFYTLVAVLAVAFAILLTVFIVPSVYAFVSRIGPEVLQSFPENSHITLQNGEVSLSGPEPLVIPMPESIAEHIGRSTIPKNLLVVDTAANFSVQKFRSEDTLVLLMKREVAFADKENDIRINDLSSVPNGTLDRPLVETAIDKSRWIIGAGLPFLIIGTLVVAFIGMLFILTGILFYLLIAALFVWGVMHIYKMNRGYKKALQISLHAASVSVVIDAVGWMTGAHVDPWFSMLLAMAIAFINLSPKAPIVQSV